ncbi:hypothetical protein APL35_gp044 [Apis mellifera filamentous virus]|uniref:hypothetical protein n=1 Tax=Apis mellifera filamentous virus TaxID=1100043 RepID=UPI0006BC19E8|nr:hypothetical protein APL35_gp044 [Apis mellifera filamentous virus]WOK43456.1 MAG: hypothetical protein [Apis mellifera filamentous virus]
MTDTSAKNLSSKIDNNDVRTFEPLRQHKNVNTTSTQRQHNVNTTSTQNRPHAHTFE